MNKEKIIQLIVWFQVIEEIRITSYNVCYTKLLRVAKDMITIQCNDIEKAIDGIIAEATHNLWEAIAEWEFLLDQKSLFKRVQEQKRVRESNDIQIVNYTPEYQSAFKKLNEEWISNYFEIEDTDKLALDHPKEYILDT